MTKPKRKQKRDDSNNTTSSQSSIERIMIKPVYTNLNEEEKKGIMELDEEEKKYVIFLSADLVFVRVPLPRCSTDAFTSLFPFLFFRSRARRLNAGEQRLFEVDEKVIQFSTLIETNSFEIDTQAKVLGISTGMIAKAWKFFDYRKLSSCTTRFLHSGEHGFNEDIMKQLGFKKERGGRGTATVWRALRTADGRLVSGTDIGAELVAQVTDAFRYDEGDPRFCATAAAALTSGMKNLRRDPAFAAECAAESQRRAVALRQQCVHERQNPVRVREHKVTALVVVSVRKVENPCALILTAQNKAAGTREDGGQAGHSLRR